MTSVSTRSRRAGLAVAAVASVLITACSAGQHTQTSQQAAAVDGGATRVGSHIAISNVRIVKDGPHSDRAVLAFTATLEGSPDAPTEATIDTARVDNATLTLDSTLTYGCSVVALPDAERYEYQSSSPGGAANPTQLGGPAETVAAGSTGSGAGTGNQAPCIYSLPTSAITLPREEVQALHGGEAKTVAFTVTSRNSDGATETETVEAHATVTLPVPPAGENVRWDEAETETTGGH